jgi:Protein of unknown function (DUF3048) N-terminal domain/Protein of unknown function (DUF3048) C-terminal domain
MPNARPHSGVGRVTAVLATVSVGFLTAACGPVGAKLVLRDSAPPTSPPASPGPAPSSPPSAPLTGLSAGRAGAAGPAVALAVAGRHPRGLSAADVVYEELGTPARYVAVFQSRQASDIGPISGIRPTDGQLLSVLRPLTGYRSGTPYFIKVLDQSSIVDLGYPSHASLYSARGGSLWAATARLERAAHAPTPPQLFPYRGQDSDSQNLASTGQWRAASATVTFPRRGSQRWASQRWVYDERSKLWSRVGGGPRARAANLVIQTVHYKTVFLSRKLNRTALAAKVLSSGPVTVLSGASGAQRGAGGLAASGQWRKPGMTAVTQYLDGGGFPMVLQPGRTWVILAPYGTRIKTAKAQP